MSVGAAPKHCSEDRPDHCAQPVGKGEPAPFAGQLLSTSLAIELGLKADRCDRLVKLEVDYTRQLLEVDLELLRNLRSMDKEAHQLQMEAMQREVDRWREAADTPFYREPWFVALVAAAVVGGVSVGMARLTR